MYNGPMFNLLFYYHFVLYWMKVNSYEKFSNRLIAEERIVWKISVFYCYRWKYSNCWKIVEFLRISIKIKNYKTFYEAQTANRLKKIEETVQSPPPPISPDKILLFLLFLWNKHFLREIHRNIQKYALKVLQDCISWASRNGAVQMSFVTSSRHQTCLQGNLWSEKGFWHFFGSILFSMWSELRFVKWVRFFEQNCIVKWVISFSLVFVLFETFC